jgi:hypothetical protein
VQTVYNSPGLITVTGAATGLTSGNATVRSVPMPEDPTLAVAHPPPVSLRNGRTSPVRVLHGRVLSIDLPGAAKTAAIAFHDARGRLIFEKKPGAARHIDIGTLPPGLYHAMVKAGNCAWNAPVLVTGK